MRSADIIKGLDVGQKWTRQVMAEERRASARAYRSTMWTVSRMSLKEICHGHMEEAWNQASDNGRLPTHWRQIFYVMRPLCDEHPESDRPLSDQTFKSILEGYLRDFAPGWDVLRGARGAFKEPHAAADDNGLAMSTMNVRGYLRGRDPDPKIRPLPARFPTKGARNRIAAVLICEKEGFDELLMAEQIPERYDLALMSTKGISALAARDLAAGLGVRCLTLHDLDKNGFVMAAGFPFATDLGLRMADVEQWDLAPEGQYHRNPERTYENLIRNGATHEEAEFVSEGQRVELNMFTGTQFIEFVETKLGEHSVEKVVPGDRTLSAAWQRAHLARRVNRLIDDLYEEGPSRERAQGDGVPPVPPDLAERIRKQFEKDDALSWDEALWEMT